jgi:hypothetical protein
MVSIRRLAGSRSPAEMTYYAQLNGEPILGTAAAKTLSTLDSQTMALTLGYFVQVQAERKLELSGLWILYSFLLIIIIIHFIWRVLSIRKSQSAAEFKRERGC